MTIQQYLDEINTLCISGNIDKHSDHADLENTVMEIFADSNGTYFNLSVLFQETSVGQPKTDKKEITINFEIVKQIADCLGLLFVNEKETEGNICFAGSREVRPEFRQSFTIIDVLDYCYALLHSVTFTEFLRKGFLRIPIPSESQNFWKLVQFGSELRIRKI